ncbi:hypothetical protein OBBRIDRAFT_117542 [Obba rivulosa]|uniref:Uncharacterized protein n=1 Tax=Obba rivulosa TaxID=1052685 RepID=A0A8E2ATY0_9APHY|nr:hypothetical protein OBBRIDRAFT_117542 [Obba rivulosa]
MSREDIENAPQARVMSSPRPCPGMAVAARIPCRTRSSRPNSASRSHTPPRASLPQVTPRPRAHALVTARWLAERCARAQARQRPVEQLRLTAPQILVARCCVPARRAQLLVLAGAGLPRRPRTSRNCKACPDVLDRH